MNTPAILDPSFQADDLVFRFVGGEKDGESVSISTKCCKLGVTRQTPEHETVKEQCSIYRGPAGVAVRSDGEVLINGEPKSVHWLEIGDRIQISGSQAVEIVQLGRVEDTGDSPEAASAVAETSHEAPSDHVAPADEEVEAQSTESQSETAMATAAIAGTAALTVAATAEIAGDRIDFMSNAIQEEVASENSSFSESADAPFAALGSVEPSESAVEESASTPAADISSGDEGVDQRFESLENSVGQLSDQAANVDRRFDRLEDSLNALTEHLERLSASGLSTGSVASRPEESAAVVSTSEAVETPEVATAGDNQSSIAALFSGLATDVPSDTTSAQTAAEAVSQTSSISEGSANQVSALADPEASEVSATSIQSDLGSATEEPIGGFTERMMDSMNADTPTLSGDEIANVVGLGIPTPENVAEVEPEAPVGLSRTEARTESVAEIFARMHSGAAATEGVGEEVSSALPLRQTVNTTFEEIEASVSAALDEDIPSMPEAEPTFDNGSVDESVEQVVAPEPVESDSPAESAADNDGGSIMERFRASLENGESVAEQTETVAQQTEQAEQAETVAEQTETTDESDGVEDYMSMLMSRMNGDSAASDTTTAIETNDVPSAEGGLLEKNVVEKLLTEEEFTPRRKAAPIKSLDKMRELANSTSRSAVMRSERAQQVDRKRSLVLQAFALGSLGLAALMIWLKSYIFGGAFTVIFFLTSAYFLFDTVSPSRSNSSTSAKNPTKKLSEPTPGSDENDS